MKQLALLLVGLLHLNATSSPSNDLEEIAPQKFVQKKMDINLFNKGLSVKMNTSPDFLSKSKTQKFHLSIKAELANNPQLVDYRLPLDLVICADVSGSMQGKMLQLLKDSMHFIIKHLKPWDRLSIVTLACNSKVHLNLIPMTEEGKLRAGEIINSFVAYGYTNIKQGMESSFNILKNRKFKNEFSSVLLISDGADSFNVTQAQFNGMASDFDAYMKKINESYIINSFGVGPHHNPNTLSAFAKVSGGSFYYIQDISSLSLIFVDSIGQALSVVGKHAYITLFLDSRADFAEKFGPYWITPNQALVQKLVDEKTPRTTVMKKIGIIYLGMIYIGMSRTFVADLTVNLSDSEIKNPKDFSLVSAVLTAENLQNKFRAQDSTSRSVKDGQKAVAQVEEDFVIIQSIPILADARLKAMSGLIKEAKSSLESFNKNVNNNHVLSSNFKVKIVEIMNPNKIGDSRKAEESSHILDHQQYSIQTPNFAHPLNTIQKTMKTTLLGSSK